MQSVTENGGSASDANRQTDVADGEVLKQAIRVDTEKVRGHLDEVVRRTVEATLNQLLDEEVDHAKRLKKLEAENSRPHQNVANQATDRATLLRAATSPSS